MVQSSIVRPTIHFLNDDQIHFIHKLSLQILDRVGIRLNSKPLLRLLEDKLGKARVEGDRVFLPAELVEWAIHISPPRIEIFNRLGDPAFRLGDDRTRFGPGVTTLYYLEPASEQVVPFTRKHMRETVRLANELPNYDVISTIGVLRDVPTHQTDLLGTLEMVANTYKPLVLLISDAHIFSTVMDLVEKLCGDLSTKPFLLPYFNPTTPLTINQTTVDNMKIAIERGLPFIFSSYGMVGASTPITMTDTFALLNAELLAGLTITQLLKEGAPIILGPMPSFFDMKTMVTFYDSHSMLLNVAFAELMSHYQIPHCGTSGSTTGWGPDIVSTGELMMNHLTCLMGKVGLAPFVGSLHGGKVFSLENMLQAHEIITKAIRFSTGFNISEADSDLDELQQVGPGGSFLTAERTLNYFRSAYEESEIFPCWSLENWQAKGSPSYSDLLKERTLERMEVVKPLNDFADLIEKGEQFVRSVSLHESIF